MKKLCVPFFIVAVLLFFFIACERIDQDVEPEGIVDLQAVSMEYGSLVSVTTAPQYPNWAQLWFEAEDGTITMVRVNWMEDKMLEDILAIERD